MTLTVADRILAIAGTLLFVAVIFLLAGWLPGAKASAQDTLRVQPLPAPAPDTLKPPVLISPSSPDTLRLRSSATDSLKLAAAPVNIDSLRKVHSPRKAGFYSAILPGLGQAYNHQYWKMPLMYAGIGTATGIFLFNFRQYIIYRDAYRLMLQGKPTGIRIIDENNYQPGDVKYVRDAYRQYVDYSALGFLGVYLYNVIDAVVFAHLYKFDISNDLGFKVGPVLHRENGYAGFGVTYFFHPKRSKLSSLTLR